MLHGKLSCIRLLAGFLVIPVSPAVDYHGAVAHIQCPGSTSQILRLFAEMPGGSPASLFSVDLDGQAVGREGLSVVMDLQTAGIDIQFLSVHHPEIGGGKISVQHRLGRTVLKYAVPAVLQTHQRLRQHGNPEVVSLDHRFFWAYRLRRQLVFIHSHCNILLVLYFKAARPCFPASVKPYTFSLVMFFSQR